MTITEVTSQLIDLAIKEDVGVGDLTSESLVPKDVESSAVLLAKQDMLICGLEIAREVFRRIDDRIVFEDVFTDGTSVGVGTVFARVSGPFREILTAERTVLNFLQRLSGIATHTARLVAIARTRGIKLFDTRKTTPGWRELEKYAVRVGGGFNHRMGLSDQVLVKNNHLDVLNSLVGGTSGGHRDMNDIIKRIREHVGAEMRVEVEVRSEDELRSALSAGVEVLLLDNMSPEMIKAMVSIVRGELGKERVFLEVSGGINEASLGTYLIEGIDAISLGMLTHSVQAVDISLHYA
jgi:nicotinate-nucleotide pyrophosphorylase (carboxylating)